MKNVAVFFVSMPVQRIKMEGGVVPSLVLKVVVEDAENEEQVMGDEKQEMKKEAEN